MEYKYVTRLMGASAKPFISVDRFGRTPVLVDTGADIPMWKGSKLSLLRWGAKDTDEIVEFTGAVGKSTGRIYELCDLRLGAFMYDVFPILYCETGAIDGHLIFPVSMFYGTRCLFDFTKGLFAVVSERNNLAVTIKQKDKVREFTADKPINTTVTYVQGKVTIPVEYSASENTLAEVILDRIHFMESLNSTQSVFIMCSAGVKLTLQKHIDSKYFI